MTTYYLNHGQWHPMRSGANTESAVIAVGVSGNGANHLGGETAVVDFTNFSVSGANPLCPPNAAPPAR